jgi:hypothetical protein
MMAMAVMAATHATALAPTTTLAPASSGSFGGDERGGADSGDGGDSENRLADHASLLVVIGCVLTSYMVCHANDPSVQQRESQIAHFVIAITFAEAIAGQSCAPVQALAEPLRRPSKTSTFVVPAWPRPPTGKGLLIGVRLRARHTGKCRTLVLAVRRSLNDE